MLTNKANKILLGIIALTSLAALTPPVNATTLQSNSTVKNIMSQAKLSFDSPTKHLQETPKANSFKEFPTSLEKPNIPFQKLAIFGDVGCG